MSIWQVRTFAILELQLAYAWHSCKDLGYMYRAERYWIFLLSLLLKEKKLLISLEFAWYALRDYDYQAMVKGDELCSEATMPI